MDIIHDGYGVLVTALGALVLVRCGYKLVANLAFFFRHSGVQRYLRNKSGKVSVDQEPWALITGSSAGLGRALADELAAEGFNIILHGSNVAKLQAEQEKLQAAHPSRYFRTLAIDARISSMLDGHEVAAKLDEVAQSLQDIRLRILINNVGMPPKQAARPELHPLLDTIDTFSYDDLLQNVSGNAIFPLLLTRALYPQLVRNQPALIVNVGSFVAARAPLFPGYGPAKAFLMTSSEELRLENMLEGRDIEVLGIDVLSFTGTDTIKEKPSLMVPTAATYAKTVMKSIGCGHSHVAPYLPHALFFGFLGVLPSWLRERLLIVMMKIHREETLGQLKVEEKGKKTL